MPERRATTTNHGDGIIAIDTEFVRPQQDASHLIVENGRAAFVDVGANSSVPVLLAALDQADVDVGDVDYVFLTHIHLDHAGGAGLLLSHLPNARCVLHPRGAPHMADPSRLMAGTIAVYGEEAAAANYGELVPIENDRIVVVDDGESLSLAGRELCCFFVVGHARHHYAIHDPASQAVFTGDSFGISYRELDTDGGAFIFPTTTPAAFDPPEAHKSVDRIMACAPHQLFLTHYSRVDDLERLADDMHTGLDAFVDMALARQADPDRLAALTEDQYVFVGGRARTHGFAGSEEALRDILSIDAVLNAQGLVTWLERRERQRR